jgi:AcrR family transcriptional regulator
MLTLKQTASKYHHGDLQSALITAGLRQVEKNGLNSLGLRQLAVETGVSPAAVYKHFQDLDHLKACIAKASREILGSMMLKSLKQLPDEPKTKLDALKRLRATGSAYIDFGVQKKNLFEIAFISFDSPDLGPDGPNSYQIFLDCLIDLNKLGALSDSNLLIAPAMAWSAVHGFASLATHGIYGTKAEIEVFKNSVLSGVPRLIQIEL